jgi:hypothetical protein
MHISRQLFLCMESASARTAVTLSSVRTQGQQGSTNAHSELAVHESGVTRASDTTLAASAAE